MGKKKEGRTRQRVNGRKEDGRSGDWERERKDLKEREKESKDWIILLRRSDGKEEGRKEETASQ